MKRGRIKKSHLFFLLLLLLIFNFLYPYKRRTSLLSLGDIASRDIIAPSTFNILKTEEQLKEERREASLKVPPILQFIEFPDTGITIRLIDSLINDIDDEFPLKRRIIRKKKGIKNLYLGILRKGIISDKDRLPNSENDMYAVIKRDTTILTTLDSIRDVEGAREYFTRRIHKLLGKHQYSRGIINGVVPHIQSNLLVDFGETEKKRNEACDLVEDSIGVVREGEKIVGAHEVVNAIVYQKLYSLHKKQIREYPSSIFSAVCHNQVYFFLVVIFILVFLYMRGKEVYTNPRFLYLFVLNMLFILFVYRFIPLYLLPLSSVVMFFTLAVDLNFGICFAISSSMIISLYQGFDVAKIIPVFMGSVVGGILLSDSQNREEWYRAGAIVSLTTGLLAFSIGFFNTVPIMEVLPEIGYGFANGLLSILILFAFLFFFGRTFNVTTNFTWMEYTDLNHPLLKRLSVEASGTYQHSLMVSSMAENAAEAIGANSLLSKVSALYHDVGKLRRPEYFAENFRNSENPHDNIPPKLSAIIIKSHITDGIMIAKEYRLPAEIVEIIKRHQGKALILPFYEKAKKYTDVLNEEDFSYDCPLPVSKEASIVMLADIVGATARSLDNPTDEEIETMISKLINRQIVSGQLAKSQLSIEELYIISRQFQQSLQGIYHQRPTYPEAE
ncbi:HDIG domain-containing protein [candidate division WOR-3 bacterium]|nr:HDIG domain-containing protein [candidate division WOR-3 bacterium]